MGQVGKSILRERLIDLLHEFVLVETRTNIGKQIPIVWCASITPHFLGSSFRFVLDITSSFTTREVMGVYGEESEVET